MIIFQVTFERFMDEVRTENIDKDSKNKVELEDLGDMIVLYLVPFELRKVFMTVLEKSEISDVQQLQIQEISKPSKRFVDETKLKDISDSLLRLEEEFKKIPQNGSTD